MRQKEKKTLSLALQGGGGPSAFTSGVLDRLLAFDGVEIEGISSTSVGALLGAVAASAMASGGRETATEVFERFWQKATIEAVLSPGLRSPFQLLFGRGSLNWTPSYVAPGTPSPVFSPYDLNRMDTGAFESLLNELVDFDRLNHQDYPRFFVAATNVRTGRAKIFRKPGIHAKAIAASACLPTLFNAVEIDGEAYWSGGFAGNPPLFPLIDGRADTDLVVVKTNPLYRGKLPKTYAEVQQRTNEITFNSTFLSELRGILAINSLIRSGELASEKSRNVKVHLIEADETTLALGDAARPNPDDVWKQVAALHERGGRAANQWLQEHYDDLGHRSTLDIGSLLAW